MDFSQLGLQGLRNAVNIHPLFAHFPLALLPFSWLLLAWGHFADKPDIRLAGRVCLYVAFLATAAAMVTGMIAMSSLEGGRTFWDILRAHGILAVVICVLTAALAVWSAAHESHRPRLPRVFLFVLALDCLLLIQVGDLGARMVVEAGAGVKNVSTRPLPHKR